MRDEAPAARPAGNALRPVGLLAVRPAASKSSGGRRSADLRQMNESNDEGRCSKARDARLREQNGCEGCQLCCRAAARGAAEYAMVGMRVAAGVMVAAVQEKLRREAFRADLKGQGRRLRGHEALRNERAHGKRRQQYARDQPNCVGP